MARSRVRSASSAVRPEAAQERTNGPLTPATSIAAPAKAEPIDSPMIRAEAAHVNASVSDPGLTTRPTSAYRQENVGAIVTPASRAQTIPSGIVRAAISGAVLITVASVSTR